MGPQFQQCLGPCPPSNSVCFAHVQLNQPAIHPSGQYVIQAAQGGWIKVGLSALNLLAYLVQSRIAASIHTALGKPMSQTPVPGMQQLSWPDLDVMMPIKAHNNRVLTLIMDRSGRSATAISDSSYEQSSPCWLPKS